MLGSDWSPKQLEYIWDLQSYRGQVSRATGWRMIEAREDTPIPPNPICHLTIPPSPPKGSLPLKRKHKKGSLPVPFFGLKFTSSQNTRHWILHTLEILMVDHQISYLSAYFQGKFYFHGSFWGGFPISAAKGSLTETGNAWHALKWILISTAAIGAGGEWAETDGAGKLWKTGELRIASRTS